MPKFKPGDKITHLPGIKGFEEAQVMKVFTETEGKFKGREMYLLRIFCGTATVPVTMEDSYMLAKASRKQSLF